MRSHLSLDLYQLTTLVGHAAEGRLPQEVGMSFFFRRMPPYRNYVLACGLRQILAHAEKLRFDPSEVEAVGANPVMSGVKDPALRQVLRELAQVDGFEGDIDAMPEGTPAFAGPAFDSGGSPLYSSAGYRMFAYTPMLQMRSSLTLAKLVETPWLGYLNYMSMVATKASLVVRAARGRPVLEFGQRRAHPDAAVDASYAAYLAGCQGTSNFRAWYEYWIPCVGTMDHFSVQACEQVGVPASTTEQAWFSRFCELFPHAATLLVDTYSLRQGIESAVLGGGTRCQAIRIDSDVSPETVRVSRQMLDDLGAKDVKIYVSGGLDEYRIQDLGAADGFGVGENITCSPDSATGIGAVGKLVLNGYGKPTRKIAGTSGKATLPGMLQVYRFEDRDMLCLADEPAPAGGTPLLLPAWRGKKPVRQPDLGELRAASAASLARLPAQLQDLHPAPYRPIWLSDALVRLSEG